MEKEEKDCRLRVQMEALRKIVADFGNKLDDVKSKLEDSSGYKDKGKRKGVSFADAAVPGALENPVL